MMNHKTFHTFNLFLAVLLALTFIVNAHPQKTCTTTVTGSQTVTVTKTCKRPTPTPNHHISCHVRDDRRRWDHGDHGDHGKHCKATKTVTCTPTITQCATPAPKCCEAGGPGFQNKFHFPQNVTLLDDKTEKDCCLKCLANPNCLQWAFPGQCVNHLTGNGDTCSNAI